MEPNPLNRLIFLTHTIRHTKVSKARQLILPSLLYGLVLLGSCTGPAPAEAPGSDKEPPSPEQLLLRNYRPRSIYRTPQSHVEKARFPAIDMHSHAYASSPEEVEAWVKTMDEKGIEKTALLTKATGAKFDSLVAVYGRFPGRFELFCGFDYTGYESPGWSEKAIRELERCVAAGAKGVGELGDKGKGLFYSEPTPAYGMHIDDPRLAPVLERCGQLGIPVSIHVAEPIWMYEPMDSTNDGLMNAYTWRLDNQTGILGHAELIQTLENAVKAHPNTTFIACHVANCSYDLDIIGRLLQQYPNLYADISARYAEMAPIPRRVNRFFTENQGKLLYGTDMGMDAGMYEITFRLLETEDEHFYETEQFGYHWPLYGYGLSEEVLRKLYRDNALKCMGW